VVRGLVGLSFVASAYAFLGLAPQLRDLLELGFSQVAVLGKEGELLNLILMVDAGRLSETA
jgi:hypothetical protein